VTTEVGRGQLPHGGAVTSEEPRPIGSATAGSRSAAGLEIADRLHTGIVHVYDQTLNNDAYAPFGGTGSSGNGSRFGSQSSWDEFTQWQWVTARSRAHGFPF
jgi:benzaldehyde dehydrogenase (NAD)